MWIARDKDNRLKLFYSKPEYHNDEWVCSNPTGVFQLVSYDHSIFVEDFSDMYFEVTFENSPVQLVPKFY